jgi:hypothetical protein
MKKSSEMHLLGDVIDRVPVWRPEPNMPSKPCRTQ